MASRRKEGVSLSAITVLVLVVVLMLIVWWRPVLKFLAVSVLILATVGTTEVVSAVISGFTPN